MDMPRKTTKPNLTSFEDVASALERRAADQELVTYNDFAKEVGLLPVNNLFSNSTLKLFFEQIDYDDAEEHRPFRTAVVVQKGSRRPGSGFFRSIEMLRGIKIAKSEESDVRSKEIAELNRYYKPGKVKPCLEIELSLAQHLRLDALAKRCGRTPAGLIERTFTSHLAHLEREIARFEEAEAQIECGETYSHEEVFSDLKKRMGWCVPFSS